MFSLIYYINLSWSFYSDCLLICHSLASLVLVLIVFLVISNVGSYMQTYGWAQKFTNSFVGLFPQAHPLYHLLVLSGPLGLPFHLESSGSVSLLLGSCLDGWAAWRLKREKIQLTANSALCALNAGLMVATIYFSEFSCSLSVHTFQERKKITHSTILVSTLLQWQNTLTKVA